MRRVVPRSIAAVLFAIAGVVGVSSAPDVLLPDLSIQERLESMSAGQRNDFLEEHPGLAMQLANTDPGKAAAWWRGKSEPEKAHILKTRPYAIGNLDGVDYIARDQANRVLLGHALHRAKKDVKATHSTRAELRLKSLTAIKHALRSRHHQPHRYLVSLTDDAPALASISVGNLNTAEQVAFTVPGMGTYTTDMQMWTQAAQNLFDEQGEVGAPKKRAVVSWMGYVPPPPGIDASLGTYAQRGAPLLRSDIAGLFEVRAKNRNLRVNVVAHSYGTTTAADALYGAPFELHAFVMIGSAGIETTVPSAAVLEAAGVYAAEASKDPLARLGRSSRTDPRSPTFGAKTFGVDGIPGAKDGRGVTGHEPILHSRWNDNPHSTAWNGLKTEQAEGRFELHMSQFGYLDRETQSIYNIAVLTTPGTRYELR